MLDVVSDIPISEKALFNEVRLKQLMQANDLEAVIGLSPASVTYLSGYHNLDMFLLRELMHSVIWPLEGAPTILMYENTNQSHTFIEDVRFYPSASERNTGLGPLVDIIREKGLGVSKIGIEKQTLTAHNWEVLQGEFPKVEWMDGSEVLEQARNIKTPEEIEILRAAASATDKAIFLAYNNARVSDTEKSVGNAMSHNVMRLGADIVAFNILASGARSMKGHFLGADVPLEKGTIMRCDFGALFDGYFTDLARMAVVGKPSQRQKDTYAKVFEIQQRSLSAVRPGITGQDLYEASIKAYSDLKFGSRPMVGHSIGLSIHERPILAPGEDWEIQEGMVLCIENGSMGIKEYGERYHIEDTVVVTTNGYDMLSDYSDTREMTVIE